MTRKANVSYRLEPEVLNENDMEDDGDFERPTDEDVFYSTYVVEPNVERILKPLYRRRFVNSIEVKVSSPPLCYIISVLPY